MPLILSTETNPGTATWVNAALLAGGISWMRKQVVQADMTADLETTITFDETIPAGAFVTGWGVWLKNIELDPAATGGIQIIFNRPFLAVGPSVTYVTAAEPAYIDSDQDYAGVTGGGVWWTPATAYVETTAFDGGAIVWPNFAAEPQFVFASRDGSLNTEDLILGLDVWLYVFYSVPASFSFPPP